MLGITTDTEEAEAEKEEEEKEEEDVIAETAIAAEGRLKLEAFKAAVIEDIEIAKVGGEMDCIGVEPPDDTREMAF